MNVRSLAVSLLLALLLSSYSYADNRLWIPGAGIGSMTFASDCTLGQLVAQVPYYSDLYGGSVESVDNLYLRKRTFNGSWEPVEPIIQYGWYQGETEDAALFHVTRGAISSWEAYVLSCGNYDEWYIDRYLRQGNGSWTNTHHEYIDTHVADWYSPALFASAQRADNTLHFAILDDSMNLYHITFDGVTFSQEIVTGFSDRTIMWGFDSPHQFRPRNLSLAVDSANTPHIAYSVDQVRQPVSGGTLQTSKLYYATKKAGSWNTSILIDHGVNTDEAGLGVSIAVAPNGTVVVASTYLPRAGTGSPGVAQLRYLVKNGSSWSSEVISQASDNYFSGDGQRDTGLFPYLVFDGASRPILFSQTTLLSTSTQHTLTVAK
jgi:hypothetical protein